MPSASGVALNLHRRQVAPLGGRTANTQNPSLHLRDGFFLWRQVWLQEACKAAIPIGVGKPGGDGEGIMLIAGAVGAEVGVAPERGIDLGNGGFTPRNLPPVKGPEMYARAELLADEAQPGDARMGGLGDGALHIEMKDGFRGAGAFFGKPPPTGIAHAFGAIARRAIAHKIHIGVIIIRWPMTLKIIEKPRPFRQQPMDFKIAEREGKAVIYADQRGWPIAERFHQPGSDALSGPVFARAGWRGHFDRRRVAFGEVNAQPPQARGGRFRA